MTLFEECKELLRADFDVVEGDDLSMVRGLGSNGAVNVVKKSIIY
ncbi:hypothetical protein ACQ9SL_004365 [Escherichia coli]